MSGSEASTSTKQTQPEANPLFKHFSRKDSVTQSIIALGSETPPANGLQAVSAIQSAISGVGGTQLRYAVSNQPCELHQCNSPLAKYIAKLHAERTTKCTKANETGLRTHAANNTPGKYVPKVTSDFSLEGLDDMHEGDMMSESFFLDANSGEEESQSDRELRLFVFRLLTLALVNHTHLMAGVRIGDVAMLLDRMTALAMGPSAQAVVSNVAKLGSLRKDPNSPWSKFAAEVTSLYARMFRPGLHKRFRVGEGTFVHCVMRACDYDPAYATVLVLLRKEDTNSKPLTIASLLEDLGKVSVDRPGSEKALSAHIGGGNPKSTKFCFDYNDGKCERGTDCNYKHELDPTRAPGGNRRPPRNNPKTPRVCQMCNGKAHRLAECPEFVAYKASKASAAHGAANAMVGNVPQPAMSPIAVPIQGLTPALPSVSGNVAVPTASPPTHPSSMFSDPGLQFGFDHAMSSALPSDSPIV